MKESTKDNTQQIEKVANEDRVNAFAKNVEELVFGMSQVFVNNLLCAIQNETSYEICERIKERYEEEHTSIIKEQVEQLCATFTAKYRNQQNAKSKND